MKILSIVLIALLPLAIFLSGCKKDSIKDPDPKPDPQYKKVEVKSFTVLQIPFTKPGGGSWEDIPLVELGPDVYWLLTDENDSVHYGTREIRFDNVTTDHLPLIRVLSQSLVLSPLSASWLIKVYDYDLIGGDDLMATLGPFKFENYKQDLPSTITLSGDSAIVKLAVEWKE